MGEGTTRFVAWNILHGGGAARTAPIALALREMGADVLVVTEFRVTRGSQIRGVLADAGLEHQVVSGGVEGNGVLLASRWPLGGAAASPAGFQGRWLEAWCPALDMTIVGVHAPDDTTWARKAAFWGHLIDLARTACDRRVMVLGDMNAGRRGQDGLFFKGEALLGQFLTLGMRDAWRHLHPGAREVSWAGAWGAGRLDAAYVTAPLWDAVIDARFAHACRTEGLSDHSPLIVTLRGRCAAGGERGNGLFSA
ncbi:MAG: endonuclease/exonuclease/phosphatase family protein [Planctomycetota bacterium]|nr:endonuclease/exonuclease/phosphatase family protein [Planctomycetota bacterium]